MFFIFLNKTKTMKPTEYQLIKKIRDSIWTKTINTPVQSWTASNCRLIKKEIKAITGISIHEKSIIRFSKLTERDSIRLNSTRYVLAMFLSGLRSDDGHYNTAAWGNMLNAIDTVTGTPTPTISGFSGKYKVYYKSKLSGDIQSDATLDIDRDGNCELRQGNPYRNRLWAGKATMRKEHLFITLENEVEFLFFIIKATFGNDYWAGVFSAVDDSTATPNSPIVLLTKHDWEAENKEKRIELFFKQRGDNYRLSIDSKLLLTINQEYNLQSTIKYLNKDIASIIGNWKVYVSDDSEIYYQSSMAINSSNDIVYQGLRLNYTGNMVIKNQDVYIYLNGEKNTLLCFSLNYLNMDKVNYILTTYATIGSSCSCPVYGSAVLVRSVLDFEQIEKKEILKNTADYLELEKTGILDKLTLKRFENRKSLILVPSFPP